MAADDAPSDRLTELCQSNALLACAFAELRDNRITNATANALAAVQVSDAEFAEFLELAIREVPQRSVYGLVLSLPEYIGRRGAGYAALDYWLARGNPTQPEIFSLAMRMMGIANPDVVVWWHQRLTTVVRQGNGYY